MSSCVVWCDVCACVLAFVCVCARDMYLCHSVLGNIRDNEGESVLFPQGGFRELEFSLSHKCVFLMIHLAKHCTFFRYC